MATTTNPGESYFGDCHIILFKIPSFQQKIMAHTKKQESMDHAQEKKKSIEIVSEKVQLLDLLAKDFKSAVITMCRELKETMSKELKETKNVKTTYCVTPFISNVQDR